MRLTDIRKGAVCLISRAAIEGPIEIENYTKRTHEEKRGDVPDKTTKRQLQLRVGI